MTTKTNVNASVTRLVAPKGKPIPFKDGTTRAKVAMLMNGKRTFEQIAKAAGVDVETAKAHAWCNNRDKHVGYSVDEQGRVKAVVRGNVKVADLIHN